MRKTLTVDDLRIMVNGMIAESAEDAREGRIALAVLLERVLMDTGNYKGFRYGDAAEGKRDDSRRIYYGNSNSAGTTNMRNLVFTRWQRLNASPSGNPRFRVFLEDGTAMETATDAALNWGLEEYVGKPLTVQLSAAGRIAAAWCNGKPI